MVDNQQDTRRCVLLHAASQAAARSVVHGARWRLMLQTRHGRGRVEEEKLIKFYTAIQSKSESGLTREHATANDPQHLKQSRMLMAASSCCSRCRWLQDAPPPRLPSNHCPGPRAACNGPTSCCRARSPARQPPSSQGSTPAALSSSVATPRPKHARRPAYRPPPRRLSPFPIRGLGRRERPPRHLAPFLG